MRSLRSVIQGLVLLLVVGTPAVAQQALQDVGEIDPATIVKFYKKPGYSPYAARNYPTRVYWGDTHLHTAWSVDAGMSGATLTPEEAVRFARGEEVVSNTGQPVKLSRSLDWIAVTDHSDGMGVISELKTGNPVLMADPILKRWNQMMAAGPEQAAAATMELIKALRREDGGQRADDHPRTRVHVTDLVYAIIGDRHALQICRICTGRYSRLRIDGADLFAGSRPYAGQSDGRKDDWPA